MPDAKTELGVPETLRKAAALLRETAIAAIAGPWESLAEHPAVVVQVVEEPVEVLQPFDTCFEGTVPEVAAAEALVLDRLAELVDALRVPLLGLSPWEACQTLFGVAGVSRPDGDASGSGLASTLAAE
ncbi:hypothetical protein [Nonomuraea indica]|uniref:hypothetical protein n=1 Tax=Nonomuraea indica TaxID=1581193 RepID=UPI000C7A4FED|nr:hypothetical protein [Nonomuraea indica]